MKEKTREIAVVPSTPATQGLIPQPTADLIEKSLAKPLEQSLLWLPR